MRSELFKVFVGNEYPFPIAYWFRRALERRESPEDARNLLEATLEYLGIVLVADYLSGEERDTELDGEFQRILNGTVSSGVWRDWIERVLTFYEERSLRPVLDELTSLRERSARKNLVRLVESRNRWVHGRAPVDLKAFRRSLFDVIERVHQIHKSSLFCPQSSRLSGDLHFLDVTVFKGDNASFSEVEFRSAVPLETDQVYIYGNESRQILPLYPFIIYKRCSACSEHHYFHFNRVKQRKLTYTSIPGGHETSSQEAHIALEQLLRYPKSRRIQCRYFSVPGTFAGLTRTMQPGHRMGPYRIEELIKIGGMAQVYRVTDSRNGQERALKLLPLELCRDHVLLMRFEEEARHLQRLEHPNIVRMRDLGQDFGDHYLVLDFVEGTRVGGKFCRDLSEVKKPLPEDTIVAIGKQICEGLHYVHSQGVIHRDLKPGNLLLSGDRVLLTDFGISRARGGASLTLTGMPVGTPEYMAPEQVQEEEVDFRTDIYALGCVLYELATGRPPYKADTPLTTALYHLQATPPGIKELNPRISRGLVNVIYKALHKNPEHRYQNARELYDDLAMARDDPAGPQVLEGEKVPQDIIEEVRAKEKAKQRRVLLTAACLVLLVALAFLGQLFYSDWRVGRWVASASELWETDRGRACENLRKAYLENPDHRDFTRLANQRRLAGSIRIEAPAGAEIRVRGRSDVVRELPPSRFPTLLTAASNRSHFEPGEEIEVSPGAYEVTVRHPDCTEVTGLVFVGYEQWSFTVDGNWVRKRLKPEDELEIDADKFVCAEDVTIRGIVLPASIPAGMHYVMSGPFWQTVCVLEEFDAAKEVRESIETEHFKHTIWFRGLHFPELEPAELEQSFLIGEKEVTVEEFDRWFVRFEEDLLAFLVRRDMREFRRRYWNARPAALLERYPYLRGEPEARRGGTTGLEAVPLDELFETMESIVRDVWIDYALRLGSYLEDSRVESAGEGESRRRWPVGNVKLLVALAYSQTHAPVNVGELRTWAGGRVAEARELREKLAELLADVSNDSAATLDSIPAKPRYWLPGDRLRDLRDLAQRSGEPFGGWMSLRDACIKWLPEESTEGIASADLLAWLRAALSKAAAHEKNLDAALRAIEGLPTDRDVPDDVEISFDVRLEYGFDTGWGLPTRDQWERAFRGPDTRSFPWGNESRWLANVDQPRLRSVDELVGQRDDGDVAPTNVIGLSGNISEWILAPGCGVRDNAEYLKGGNFRHAQISMRGGYLIQIDLGGKHAPWTGFRVVKEALPPGAYKRALSTNSDTTGTVQ